VLLLFLRDVRASLIVASVIPLSMLIGFIGMRVFECPPISCRSAPSTSG